MKRSDSSVQSGKDLFVERKKEHRREIRKLWKLAVDWSVWLYFIIPIVGVIIYQYIELWQGTAHWGFWFHPVLIGLIFVFTILDGYWITYLKQADLLMLWQKDEWIADLRKTSLIHYLRQQLMKLALAYFFFLPILLIYLEWSLIDCVAFFVLLYASNCIVTLNRKQLELRFHKWWMRLTEIPMILLFGGLILLNTLLMQPVWLLASILLSLAVAVYFIKHSIQKPIQFYSEVALEANRLNQLGKFILSQSAYMGAIDFSRKRSYILDKPVLFRNSKQILSNRTSGNGLVEAYLKSSLRDFKKITIYFRLLFIGGFALTMITLNFSLHYSWIFFSIIIFVLVMSVRDFWYDLTNQRYFHLADWKTFNTEKSIKKGTFILLLPGIILISMYQGYLTYDWMGLFLLPVIVTGVVWLFLDFFVTRIALQENFYRMNHLNDL